MSPDKLDRVRSHHMAHWGIECLLWLAPIQCREGHCYIGVFIGVFIGCTHCCTCVLVESVGTDCVCFGSEAVMAVHMDCSHKHTHIDCSHKHINAHVYISTHMHS